MKIWIVYDSKFGNNKKVVQKMDELLNKNHEVHVNYAKKISPKKVLAASPDIFLFGGPRRVGKISKTLRKWVERFTNLLHANKIQLEKVGAWETRAEMNEEASQSESAIERKIYEANLNLGEKWLELIENFPVKKKPLDLLSLIIVGMEGGALKDGRLEENAMEKVNDFIDRFEKS